MRKLYIYGLLGFGIYYMLTGGAGIAKNLLGINTAQVIAGLTTPELNEKILSYYRETVLSGTKELQVQDIETTITNINTDDKDDVIAIVNSDATCGTGGCIASIFTQDEMGELIALPFTMTVRRIEVLASITNGMHDLRINQDEKSRMIWDGAQYVLEQI